MSGLTNPEHNMIDSMESDDGKSQFNNDIFNPRFWAGAH
jgi:hypothetical protein